MAAERRSAGEPATLRVTWSRSTIGHTAATRGTIRALGLHRLHQSVEVADTPVTRGMLRRAAFLLDVEEANAAAPGARRADDAAASETKAGDTDRTEEESK